MRPGAPFSRGPASVATVSYSPVRYHPRIGQTVKKEETSIILINSSNNDHAMVLARDVEHARRHEGTPRADATRRAFASDWRGFCGWCDRRGVQPTAATPEHVRIYLSWLAETHPMNTVQRAYTGVLANLRIVAPDTWPPHWRPPEIRDALASIRREIGTGARRKTPTGPELVAAMVGVLPVTGAAACRDRALLLLGFAGAYRRSELVAVAVEDLAFTDSGMTVVTRRSKTRQTEEYTKGVVRSPNRALCPVAALERWLRGAHITSGKVFRRVSGDSVLDVPVSDRYVARLVQRCTDAAGLEGDFAGHSLRAGFITWAALEGRDTDSIMRQSGHESLEQMRAYIRRATVLQNNASEGAFDAISVSDRRRP